jgi:HK97 family phage major capsid protein
MGAEAEVLTKLEGAVEKLDKGMAAIQKRLDEPDYSALRRDEQGRVTGFLEDTDETVELQPTTDRAKADTRRSYRDTKRHVAKQLKSAGYKPWGGFSSFTELVRMGMEAGGADSKFRDTHAKHFEPVRKAVQGMSEGVGTDGGVTVMPEFSNKIIDRVYSNDLLARTDSYTVAGNNMTFLVNAETSRATGSRHGGLQAYSVGEGATITKSKPTLRALSMKLIKVGAVVYLTDELIADGGQALEQWVARKVAEEFNFWIGDGLVNGTGVGQLLGILNAPSLVSVAKETGQTAATLQAENIVKMYSRFYAGNLGNSVWLHNQDIGPQLDLLTLGIGAAGIAVYMPPNGLADAPYGTLRGRPLLPTEFNATLGTQGDLILADMGQIISITKGGIVQAVSMHVEFLTEQTALRFTMRLNARPWESAPITPYKGSSNTQSNFVTLDARA